MSKGKLGWISGAETGQERFLFFFSLVICIIMWSRRFWFLFGPQVEIPSMWMGYLRGSRYAECILSKHLPQCLESSRCLILITRYKRMHVVFPLCIGGMSCLFWWAWGLSSYALSGIVYGTFAHVSLLALVPQNNKYSPDLTQHERPQECGCGWCCIPHLVASSTSSWLSESTCSLPSSSSPLIKRLFSLYSR